MRDSGFVDILLRALGFLLIQILLLSNVIFFEAAQIWLYVGLLVTLPLSISRVQVLFFALLYGLIMDLFYNTLGLHMACTVLIAFLQPVVLKLFLESAPSSATGEGEYITVKTNGLVWFLLYAGTLFLIHHFTYYIIDAAGFNWFGYTVKKIILSTIFSLFTFLIAVYLFYPSGSKR